jgi:DNA-binding transcriptional regulator YdaS (Cro superfamily)
MDKRTQDKILAVVGTQVALAQALGKRQQTVNEWFMRGRIPAHHVLRVVELSGGAVSAHEIRPDVFGPKSTSNTGAIADEA